MNDKLLKKKVKKYTKILSLSRKKIEVNVYPSIKSEVYWDEKVNKWIINCRELNGNFDLIHELGHIFLAKKLTL